MKSFSMIYFIQFLTVASALRLKNAKHAPVGQQHSDVRQYQFAHQNMTGGNLTDPMDPFNKVYYNVVAPKGTCWCVKDNTDSCSYSWTAAGQVCYEAACDARIDYLDMVYKDGQKHPFLAKTGYADAANYATWQGSSCAARGYTTDKKLHPCFRHAFSAFKSVDAQMAWRVDRQKSCDDMWTKQGNGKCVDMTEMMLKGECDHGY